MRYNATGLPARLLAFFMANPDEELSFADICAKFDVGISNARYAVDALGRDGHVESVHVVRLNGKGRAVGA